MGIGEFFKKWKRFVGSGREGLAIEPVASLQKVVQDNNLAINNLTIAWEQDLSGMPVIKNRQEIFLYDGEKIAPWAIFSLQELFRGARLLPSRGEMERYPEEYIPFFYLMEGHVIQACDVSRRDLIDDEFVRIYSGMRRCPEGKSFGFVHDAVYQAAALALAMESFSRAEFEAVFDQLARSARHWREGCASRNYVRYLRENFKGGESKDGV